AIFFAPLCNTDLSMSAYVAIIVTSSLRAVRHAAVPGPSFLGGAGLLSAGTPIAALPLPFALDRILAMIRTAPTITADAASAAAVDSLITDEQKEDVRMATQNEA